MKLAFGDVPKLFWLFRQNTKLTGIWGNNRTLEEFGEVNEKTRVFSGVFLRIDEAQLLSHYALMKGIIQA